MFPSHDPYQVLIPNLAKYWNYEVQLSQQTAKPRPKMTCDYCNEITDKLKILLTAWKPYLQQVRDAYGRVPTTFDYNSRYQKSIYMLAYFPFYIEPIYYSLENHVEQIKLNPKNKLTVSILGGGPLPELIGIAKLIEERKGVVQEIIVNVFDKHQNWVAEIESCTQQLLPNYFAGRISYNRFEVDLTNLESSVISNIVDADIIVLQNTINDISPSRYGSIRKSLLKIWDSLKISTLFVVLDLNFNEVRDFMRLLQNKFIKLGGRVVSQLNTIPIEHRPNIPFCSHLERRLFSSQSGLISRRKVNYYRFVVLK